MASSCTETRASTEHVRGGRQSECLPLPTPPGHLQGPIALLLGLGPLQLLEETRADRRLGILAQAPQTATGLTTAKGVHMQAPLRPLLSMLLTLLLLLPWLAMEVLLWLALGTHQGRDCRPPLQDLAPLAPLL